VGLGGELEEVEHGEAATHKRRRIRSCEIYPPGRSKSWHLKLTSYHGIFGHKRLGNIGELACILGVPRLSVFFWNQGKAVYTLLALACTTGALVLARTSFSYSGTLAFPISSLILQPV
jgi:hypothetical protein